MLRGNIRSMKPWITLFKTYRFGVLLFFQILLLVLDSLAQGHPIVEEVFLLGTCCVLIASGLAIADDVAHKRLLLAAGIGSVALSFVAYMTLFPVFDVASLIVNTLFIAAILFLMARHIVRSGKADTDLLFCAISLYVLFGIVFGYVYMMINLVDPVAFHEGLNPLMVHVGYHAGRFFYYSFVTLMTLGYGDIVPLSPLARTFSVLEALTGQLYIAIIISRLIGLHLNTSKD